MTMSKMKEHEQALIDMGRLIAALHPTDVELRGALNRCIQTFGQVETEIKPKRTGGEWSWA